MNLDYKRALVTGGAGFIGSHLVDRLNSLGIEVCVIDNFSSGLQKNILKYFTDSNVLIEDLNIIDSNTERIFKVFRPEIVFHLAARSGVYQSTVTPGVSAKTNLYGMQNILHLSEKYNANRFIFASSSSVYGGTKKTKIDEEKPLNPKSPYAFQKFVGEEYVKYYSNNYNMDGVSLRLFNVFGPRQRGDLPHSAVIPAFLNSKKIGSRARVFGDGEQTRDFCYVSNVVDAFILASNYEKKFLGESFNISCGENTSINNIIKNLEIKEFDYYEDRSGDVKHSWASFDKAKKYFNYSPKISVNEGLKITKDWYFSDQEL